MAGIKKTRFKFCRLQNYDWQKLSFELLVVFLGVTAGFLLNNWRIDNQESKLETKYIEGFYQDVSNNIIDLESSIADDSIWLEKATPFLHTIMDHTIHPDSARTIMRHIVQISRLTTSKGTYLDIINSGNLNILSDFTLKSALVDYHVKLEGTEFVDDYFYQYFNNLVIPFIMKEFDVLQNEFADPDIIHTVQFSNVFAGYYSMVQQRKGAFEDLLNQSYALKDLLESNN
jgi:hypothetical protein